MVKSAEILKINIEDEMKSSYLDYAMSVIIGRALPDVRDGLKPAHRRVLYAMYSEGLLSNKRYSKCAGVVGEVLKKYHPHGDSSVYDTLVRMAQDWNMRYPLIDGQGNFGSVDGDSAAAYRYTEARLAKIAEEMLSDIDKETVDFVPNFDGSTEEPVVLPSRTPNLLINGSEGIAVGMATKIPPHNLNEVCEALLALVKDPALTIKELMKYIPGPDFPTAAFIHGRDGIKQAYETGRGIIQMRARASIEPVSRGDREAIIITEIPYQVNKARLIERIAELVRDGKLEGISDLRDESDRDGMRIAIELKKGAVAGVILNQLYKHTSMQETFGMIMLAIVNSQPKVLNLKEYLGHFIDHRKEVVTRRTAYELRKAEERAHVLAGLKIAVENIDEVIALIKRSKSPEEAKNGLMKKFELSAIQAQAVLDMRLQKLTGLEREKIIAEYKDVMELIKKLKEILSSEKLILSIISNEISEIKEKYGDKRRTEILAKSEDLTVEDLIAEEDMVVTVSHFGYIKRNPISIYRAQRRGGRGKQGMTMGDEDFVSDLFIASTHSHVMIFTQTGKGFWLKVHEIPQIGRTAKGKAITNLVQMASDDKIAAILPVRKFEEGKFVVLATRKGLVKKTELMEYSNPRASGIVATKIEEGDEVVSVKLTAGKEDIFLTTADGQSIRFKEEDVRSTGRATYGVWGITLSKGDEVVSMETITNATPMLTCTQNGYGKRTELAEYRIQGRGGSGIITIQTTDRNGKVVGAMQIADTDDIMMVTNKGKVIRTHAKHVGLIGRNTQGVRLISLEKDEKLISIAKLAEKEEEVEAEE
ncbi:MAG: DNA gyrase subunit A [Deltaproteobacteria bacterium CG11_big_fil_rev_8_21_14_0_20_49_13]|nr:MAG: DNA gyrase subunit A [Deltaproteobacteria bacterium CG11_big_fil_rev_8_21_14_0_20_49_13]